MASVRSLDGIDLSRVPKYGEDVAELMDKGREIRILDCLKKTFGDRFVEYRVFFYRHRDSPWMYKTSDTGVHFRLPAEDRDTYFINYNSLTKTFNNEYTRPGFPVLSPEDKTMILDCIKNEVVDPEERRGNAIKFWLREKGVPEEKLKSRMKRNFKHLLTHNKPPKGGKRRTCRTKGRRNQTRRK